MRPDRSRMTGLRATVLREYMLLARNRVSLALGIVPPTVFLLLFATSISGVMPAIAYDGQIVAYQDFILPAIVLMSMLSAASATATSLFQEQQSGMLLELWSYPLSKTSYIAGKLAATTTLVLLQGLLLLIVAWVTFHPAWPADHVAALLLAGLLTSFALNGLYLFVSTLFHQMQTFMIVVNISTPVLLFASPSFYPQDQMPDILRGIAWFNPVSYGIRAVRDGLIFGPFHDSIPIALLVALGALMLVLTSRSLSVRFDDL